MSELRRIASQQHGLLARQQARDLGIGRSRIRRLVSNEELSFVSPRVLRVTGSGHSPWESVMAGVLDAGFDAMASHLTAAAMWGAPGLAPEPVHVSVTRVLRRRDLAASRIHHLTLVPAGQRTRLHEIPVSAPPLTVLLVCGLEGKYAGARVLDHMLASRLTTVAETWQLVDRMSKQGRNGLVHLRDLLEDRSDDDMPAQSNNERRFEEICRRSGLWTLRRQVTVDEPAWIARVDFRDTEVTDLVVEVHSERYHTTSAHRRADAARIARLEAAGLTVVVVWDYEIWHDADRAVSRVLAARRRLMGLAETVPD